MRVERPAIIEGDIAKIPLGVDAKQGYAIVDVEHAHLASKKWNRCYYGYALGDGSKLRLHRVIMSAAPGQVIDHINGDKLDNRRSNLRFCTKSQNSKNMKLSVKNKSGYKGVSWSTTMNKWEARVRSNYRTKVVGYFVDAKDAAKAYDDTALILHGQFARTNKIMELI